MTLMQKNLKQQQDETPALTLVRKCRKPVECTNLPNSASTVAPVKKVPPWL